MKLLELSSGTTSVGNVADILGYAVISLDLNMLTSIVLFLTGIIPHIQLHMLM